MKSKLIVLSMLFASASVAANAQEANAYYAKKWTDNIFVGAGVGAMSTFNDGMNTTFNFNISVGKYITPTWGTRLQFGGFQQKIGEQKTGYAGDTTSAFEFNLDGMLNLTNLFGGNNPDRALDVYVFAGPTLNIAKAWNENITFTQTTTGDWDNGYKVDYTAHTSYESHGSKARIGATVGLGFGYNVNSNWAINLEGRFGVTPSVFGAASDFSKAEGTGRLTIGATYTFGGKKFAKAGEAKIVEKEVIKEVVKEVPVEVVKEVIKEIPGKASAAIFFKIGKAVISPEGMVNVKVMAKVMKENPSTKYKIAGFADKGTGSAKTNQTLSEKRAQAVYDALIAEGISADRLEKVGMGGTDPMFEKAYLNRVVILETK